MKYPALIIYRRSGDGGMELKYSIRSLNNLTNWNGEVIVVGDKEDWFNLDEIRYIPYRSSHHNPYKDAEDRLTYGLSKLGDIEDFIFFNDDFYVLEPGSRLKDFHQGEIARDQPHNLHKQALKRTRELLVEEFGIKSPLNYAVHTPMIMNKDKRLKVSAIIRPSLTSRPTLARVIYGNLYATKPHYYPDHKTYGDELATAPFISTHRFTPELEVLFTEPSRFELPMLPSPQHATVHMIWIGSPMTAQHRRNISTYRDRGYDVKVWTKPPKEFVNRDLYDRARSYALKADYMRLEILYQEGGLYADIDSVMLRPLDITSDLAVMTTPNGYCGNETIYAEKGHPAIKELIDGARDHLESLEGQQVNIWDIVGATYITPILRKYSPQVFKRAEIGVLGSLIRHKYSATWRKGTSSKATKFDLKEWIDE